MKTIFKIAIVYSLYVSSVLASPIESFVNLAKKTSSVYAGYAQVDENNPESMTFETLIDNQTVSLKLSSKKMNSSVYTMINANGNPETINPIFKALPNPPEVYFGSLNVTIEGGGACTSGSPVDPMDTSCGGKSCNLKELIVSKCNESECWSVNPETPRLLQEPLNGAFELAEKMNISSCLVNNNEGVLHRLKIEELLPNSGGVVSYQIFVVNDVED